MKSNTFHRFFANTSGSLLAVPSFVKKLHYANQREFTYYADGGLRLSVCENESIQWRPTSPTYGIVFGDFITGRVVNLWARQITKEHLLRDDLSHEGDNDSVTCVTLHWESIVRGIGQGKITSVSVSHTSQNSAVWCPISGAVIPLSLAFKSTLQRCRTNRKVFQVIDAMALAASEREDRVVSILRLSAAPSTL